MVDIPGVPNALRGHSSPPSAPSINLTELPPGQRVVATVVSAMGSTLTLNVGGKTFNLPLQGAPKLAPGDQLVLEGSQASGTIQVKELVRKDSQALNRNALESLWRGAAGRDQSLRPLAQTLQQALGPPQPGQSPAQPPALRALHQGLAAIPLKGLSGETLKAALEESGLFFEARLRQGAATEGDRRGQLLRAQGELRAQASTPPSGQRGSSPLPEPGPGPGIRAPQPEAHSSALPPVLSPLAGQTEPRRRVLPSPGRGRTTESAQNPRAGSGEADAENPLLKALGQQIDQGLARVRLLQHHTLSQSVDQPSWLLELPVATGAGEDFWRLQFEAQGHRPGEPSEERRWMARIAVAPATGDRIEGQITLQGMHLTGHLWCEAATTENRLTAALAGLRDHLLEKGFTGGQFHIHAGRAPRHLQVMAPGARP